MPSSLSKWKDHIEPVTAPYGRSANRFDYDITIDIPGVMITGPWHPCMAEYMVERDIRALYLNPSRGFICENFSFLEKLPQLELLSISHPYPLSYGGPMPLDSLVRLRNLELFPSFPLKTEADFRKLPNLISCALKWCQSVESIFQSKSLERLHIYSLRNDRLSLLGQITTLKNLQLSSSGIRSLSDLTPLNKLEFLSLEVCRNLESLQGIEKFVHLKFLSLDEVHKIESLDHLKSLTKLEALLIGDCGEIESLAPLVHLKNLKAVAFTGGKTKVRDGDLTPLTCLPRLSMLNFADRRHYSHKLVKRWNWANFDKPDQLLVLK